MQIFLPFLVVLLSFLAQLALIFRFNSFVSLDGLGRMGGRKENGQNRMKTELDSTCVFYIIFGDKQT